MTETKLPTCRGCGLSILPGEPVAEVAAYWTPHTRYPVHAGCRQRAQREEAYECQLIDADCNDCRHFERDTTFKPKKGIRPASLPGRCAKFGKPTIARPNTATGHCCFEHRRAET